MYFVFFGTSTMSTHHAIRTFSDATSMSDVLGDKSGKYVILFTADWHEACAKGGPMDQLLHALAAATGNGNVDVPIAFGRCDAEENPQWSEKCEITAVPTFCLIFQGKVVDRIVGGDDAATVTTAVQRLSAMQPNGLSTTNPLVPPPETLPQRLDRLIRSSPVMIFIKGTPTQPKCGFSRQVVHLLHDEDIPFASFDILSDDSVRQGLKTHSDWPTYPQVYVHGELIGGLDIVRELQTEGGSLADQWKVQKVSSTSPIVASADTNVTSASSPDDRLKQLVNRSSVMLFMKGLPSAPQCGFSRQIVQILDESRISYDAFDILSDEEVRQGLKVYSDWPTYPQLYVTGELIGGLDIVREMSEDGTLAEALAPGGSSTN
jgi:Grx4 family monothiol glutaredoxin